MKYLFLMDPLEYVDIEKDTSFIFMVGAHRRGHEVYYLPSGHIHFEEGAITFEAENVIPQVAPGEAFIRSSVRSLSAASIDAVFVRTEPPFDERYLMDTWLLELLPKRVVVINDPAGIRAANEKIWALRFADLAPPTLVTNQRSRFQRFLSKHKNIIAKPTDGYGGMGIFKIQQGDTNAQVIFDVLSHHGTKEIMIQPFVPEADQGDKRILLLNGEPLGAVLRVHGEEDHRNNFFAGGKPFPTEITERDREIITTLKPRLQKLGLYFVGIDVIGEYLIEVNVTSPTCVQEINRIYDQRLEDQVMAFVEQKVSGNA